MSLPQIHLDGNWRRFPYTATEKNIYALAPAVKMKRMFNVASYRNQNSMISSFNVAEYSFDANSHAQIIAYFTLFQSL